MWACPTEPLAKLDSSPTLGTSLRQGLRLAGSGSVECGLVRRSLWAKLDSSPTLGTSLRQGLRLAGSGGLECWLVRRSRWAIPAGLISATPGTAISVSAPKNFLSVSRRP